MRRFSSRVLTLGKIFFQSAFVGNGNVVRASVASVTSGCSLTMVDSQVRKLFCFFNRSLCLMVGEKKQRQQFLNNSYPQFTCEKGTLSLDKMWSPYVQCSECDWSDCPVVREKRTFCLCF
jgi:hypothetical protein